MRPLARSVIFMVPLFCGCQAVQVQKMSNELTSTVPNLYEQEVLDDLAMTAANPAGLPYFGIATQGSSANTRTISAGYTGGWDMITSAGYFLARTVFDKQTAQLTGMSANADTFQVQPVSNPDKLLLIQSALRKVSGVADEPEIEQKLMSFLQAYATWAHYEQMVQPGWFVVGKKHDVPKHACYVGHYCGTYVWVPPDHLEDLKRLTLVVLDIATFDPGKLPIAAGVRAPDFAPRETIFPYPAPPSPP